MATVSLFWDASPVEIFLPGATSGVDVVFVDASVGFALEFPSDVFFFFARLVLDVSNVDFKYSAANLCKFGLLARSASPLATKRRAGYSTHPESLHGCRQ